MKNSFPSNHCGTKNFGKSCENEAGQNSSQHANFFRILRENEGFTKFSQKFCPASFSQDFRFPIDENWNINSSLRLNFVLCLFFSDISSSFVSTIFFIGEGENRIQNPAHDPKIRLIIFALLANKSYVNFVNSHYYLKLIPILLSL